jgi:hypothetical protein
MFMLRNTLTAHFSSWAGRMEILDDVWLPKWLDRRWGISRKRDRQQFEHAEHAREREPVGKDATKDW